MLKLKQLTELNAKSGLREVSDAKIAKADRMILLQVMKNLIIMYKLNQIGVLVDFTGQIELISDNEIYTAVESSEATKDLLVRNIENLERAVVGEYHKMFNDDWVFVNAFVYFAETYVLMMGKMATNEIFESEGTDVAYDLNSLKAHIVETNYGVDAQLVVNYMVSMLGDMVKYIDEEYYARRVLSE